jgi:3-oxoadipate enol-lactonase
MDLWSESFLTNLALHYRVITFDNRGIGGSSGPRPISMTSFAADIAALIEHLGLERVHVLGMSMGGMIAQQLTVNHPERIDRLVLGATSCAAKFIRPRLGVLAGTLFYIAPHIAIRALVSPEYLENRPDRVREMVDNIQLASGGFKVFLDQLNAILHFDLAEAVEAIKCPTLIITGTSDQLINCENSSLLAQKIRGAELIQFKGVGHMFPRERAVETVAAMKAFLG